MFLQLFPQILLSIRAWRETRRPASACEEFEDNEGGLLGVSESPGADLLQLSQIQCR